MQLLKLSWYFYYLGNWCFISIRPSYLNCKDIQISLFFLIIRQVWDLRGRRWEKKSSYLQNYRKPSTCRGFRNTKSSLLLFFSCLNNIVTQWWLMHYTLFFSEFSNYGLEFRHNTKKERNTKYNTFC